MNLSNVMVVNFSTGERTAELSQLCFKKLGFNNVVLLEGQDGFVDKFFRFAEIGLQSNCSIFIRSDADRLVFDGILDLLEKFTDTETDCAEGTGFEFFMNRYRGATPHIFSRKILELLLSRPELMPNIQKPEQNFLNNAVNTGNIIEKTYKVLTNLHEFEQYPSKVCNSFMNRISRGHMSYYDHDHLGTLIDYFPAMNYAHQNHANKSSMDHLDLGFLDKDFPAIDSSNLDAIYDIYNSKFEVLKKRFNKN